MINSIVVSNQRTVEPVAAVRDPRQRAAVEEIVTDPTFDFACGNPFVPEVGDYTGPFSFLYYTKDGRLHSQRIGKTGRTLKHVVAS